MELSTVPKDPRINDCRIITDFFVPLLALCTRREAVQVGRTRGHIIPTFNDARTLSSGTGPFKVKSLEDQPPQSDLLELVGPGQLHAAVSSRRRVSTSSIVL